MRALGAPGRPAPLGERTAPPHSGTQMSVPLPALPGAHRGVTDRWLRGRGGRLMCLPPIRFHDLRHTAGTYLNEAGASAIQFAAALGHKTLAMAKRYSHQSPEFTRSVFDKLTKRMAKKSGASRR